MNDQGFSTPSSSTRQIWADGLWQRNAGLVQLLGLCPLLAVTTHLAYGLGLGLATTAVMLVTSLTVSLLRGFIASEIRLAVYVLIIAGTVTVIERLLQAWALPLYQALGIFLPLIVTNCAILARAEIFAARQPPAAAVTDALATGIGFTLVLVVLGGVRELVGQGTLFDRLDLVLGAWSAALRLEIPIYDGVLIGLLAPGAFITLGLLIAAHRALSHRQR
ncbi:MAG: electron transport complex subunit E [Pseudomonadota bacterium]